MKKILFLEDDKELAEVMGLFLNSRGYHVYHYEIIEGFAAYLEIIKDLNPDVILSDIFVPAVDGRDLCKFIKENDEVKHIPYVLYSAMHLSEEERKTLCGDAFIANPLTWINLNTLSAMCWCIKA